MYGTFLHEPELIGFAYDLEQELQARTPPRYLGHVPPEPPDAGICDASRAQPAPAMAAFRHLTRHFGTGKPFPR